MKARNVTWVRVHGVTRVEEIRALKIVFCSTRHQHVLSVRHCPHAAWYSHNEETGQINGTGQINMMKNWQERTSLESESQVGRVTGVFC
jgi:hypothetical protein